MSTNDNLIIFFTNQTNNISTVPISCPFNKGALKVWGVWGSADIAIKTGVPTNPNYFIPVTDYNGNPVSFIEDGGFDLEGIVIGDNLVVILSNASGTTSLNVTLQRL